MHIVFILLILVIITSETCHNDPTWIYFSKYEYIRLFNIEDNKVLLFYYKTNNQPMMRVVNVGTNDVTYKTEIEFTPRCTKWY